jgi:hypothetical protein
MVSSDARFFCLRPHEAATLHLKRLVYYIPMRKVEIDAGEALPTRRGGTAGLAFPEPENEKPRNIGAIETGLIW